MLMPLSPLALDHAIRSCLAKNPDDRWQTARDLSHELKWIGESGSEAGVPLVAGRSSRAVSERIAWAAAAGFLCALAGLGFLYVHKATLQPAAVVRAMIPPPTDNQFPAFAA